jgi:hypothetical protein
LELSGGLKTNDPTQLQSDHPISIDTKVNATDLPEMEKVYKTLLEVTKVLDDVLYRKTLTIKQLDKLIREKRKTLSDPDEHLSNGGLSQKRWLRQLIEDREDEL